MDSISRGVNTIANDTCKGAGAGVAVFGTIGGVLGAAGTAPLGCEGAIPGAVGGGIVGLGIGATAGALYGIWDAVAGGSGH